MFSYKTGEGEGDSKKKKRKEMKKRKKEEEKHWTAFIIGAWALLILTAYQHRCRRENN